MCVFCCWCCRAQGIIQLANKHALKMLGYAKGELDGKNVSVIMPQPFSARHNGYLRNFVTTGGCSAGR